MKINRILAVKLADLGDALLIVPALRALKQAYPQACLDVLTTKTGQAGLEGLPYIDQFLTFDKYQFDDLRGMLSPNGLAKLVEFGVNLRRQNYDAVVFFHHFSSRFGALKFRGLAYASGARQRLGLDPGDGRASFLNLKIEDGGFGADGQSERDYWRKLVQALTGPGFYDDRPEIFISETDQTSTQLLLAQVRGDEPDHPLIAFGPGGGNYSLSRRWPAVNYARLGDRLIEQTGAKIVLLGTKSEQGLGEQIRQMAVQPQNFVNLAGETNVKESVAFLKGCQLFVGNDGGLAQLAGFAEIPAVVIFGPTNATAWAPFGTESGRVELVQARQNLPCRPCLYRGKTLGSRLGCGARPCLTTIRPAQVLETIRELERSYVRD